MYKFRPFLSYRSQPGARCPWDAEEALGHP
jgi:hypothetical protein